MDRRTRLVRSFIEWAQDRLAIFARESYAAEGRGYIYFTVPPIPDPDQQIKMEMVYYVLTQVQRLAADRSGVLREQADILIRMIETYDPATQAVVMAVGTGDPIAIKMRLEMPFIVDEVGGVH